MTKQDKKIDFSIAIPAFNEERDLVDCLKSIEMQNYPKDKIEVIVVDNYSKDNTIKIAKSFSKKLNIKVLKNKTLDAESSKLMGFNNSKGDFFMYLDADMRFGDKDFVKKMLYPLKQDKKIGGVFVKFIINKKHPSLTRTLSYDEFQRDPIFEFFTLGINDIVIEKNRDYWLCNCFPNRVPPQALMIYRKALVEDYAKTQSQLIDNEIPAVIAEKTHYFAFVPSTGVEHLLLRSLKELWRKRIINLERTYFPNEQKRKFKWINWKKDWSKIGIWLVYTNSIIFPIIVSLYKCFKYKDICFLNEPILNIVSTYAIIFGVLSNKLKK